MADGQITADGDQAFQTVNADGVHLALAGSFGTGTVSVEQEINGTVYPLRASGTAITFTAADDVILNVRQGDKIRLSMAGSTAPVVDFNLAGAAIAR